MDTTYLTVTLLNPPPCLGVLLSVGDSNERKHYTHRTPPSSLVNDVN